MKSEKHVLHSPDDMPAVMRRVKEIQLACGESSELAAENLTIFYEVCAAVFDQLGEDSRVTITIQSRRHRCTMQISVMGKSLVLGEEGSMVLHYGERVIHKYSLGINTVIINRTYGSDITIRQCLIMFILAVAIGAVINYFNGGCDLYSPFVTSYVLPMETIFVNAMQLIAAPVSFICFVSTITGTNETLNNKFNVRGVIGQMLFTSAIALLLGYIISAFYTPRYLRYSSHMSYYVTGENSLTNTVKDFILSLIPSNIFAPFLDANPLPLIILATVFGLAGCHPGHYHGRIVMAIESAKDLICRVLSLIYQFLPLAFFFSILDITICTGMDALRLYSVPILSAMIVLFLLLCMYFILLLINGLRPVKIIRILLPAIRENLKIGSNIDAVDYNVRMLNAKLGIPSGFLRDVLNLGARQNMDANCACLMLFAMFAVSITGFELTLLQTISLLLVIIFLSLGSPNQPGSILLGVIIIFGFLGLSNEMAPIYILLDVVTCKFTAFINTMGDLTVVICEANKQKLMDPKLEIYAR